MDNQIRNDLARWCNTTTGTSWSDVCELRNIVPTMTTTSIDVATGMDYTRYFKKDIATIEEVAKAMKVKKETVGNMMTTISVEKVNFELSRRTKIQSIKVYVPEKVMGVRIDGHEYKQVVKEPDEFSMEFGCALAMAKHMFGKTLTPEGIELAAHIMLLYLKCVKDEIRRAIKAYHENEAVKAKTEKEKEEIKAIKERRRAKAKKKREADCEFYDFRDHQWYGSKRPLTNREKLEMEEFNRNGVSKGEYLKRKRLLKK